MNDFASLINSFGSTASGILGALRPPAPAAPSPVAGNASSGTIPTWVKPVAFIVGGVVVLLVILKVLK